MWVHGVSGTTNALIFMLYTWASASTCGFYTRRTPIRNKALGRVRKVQRAEDVRIGGILGAD